jgi:uncharacterized protein with von Willebrand factor type A (vWA) domain
LKKFIINRRPFLMDKIEKNKLIIKYINRITKFTLKAEQEAKKVKAKARNKTRHEYILGSLAPNSTIEALDYSRSNSFLTKAVKNELREIIGSADDFSNPRFP